MASPSPQCPRGRTVRLANVVTLCEHRGAGYGTVLFENVTEWAQIDQCGPRCLSAPREGQCIYTRAGCPDFRTANDACPVTPRATTPEKGGRVTRARHAAARRRFTSRRGLNGLPDLRHPRGPLALGGCVEGEQSAAIVRRPPP